MLDELWFYEVNPELKSQSKELEAEGLRKKIKKTVVFFDVGDVVHPGFILGDKP